MCLLHLNYEYYQCKIFNNSIDYNFLSVGSVEIVFFFLSAIGNLCFLSLFPISLKKLSILFSDSFKELDFALFYLLFSASFTDLCFCSIYN